MTFYAFISPQGQKVLGSASHPETSPSAAALPFTSKTFSPEGLPSKMAD